MKLALLFDHRFYRDADGVVFSTSNYNHQHFADRYLQVFDDVALITRVSTESPPRARGAEQTEGPGLRVVDTGDWGSIRSLAARQARIRSLVRSELGPDTATIGVVPGRLAYLGIRGTRAHRGPFGLEMIGDPAESMTAGAVSHPARRAIASIWPRLTQSLVARASAVAYVSEHTLPQRFPAAADAFTTHYSSINLPDDAIASTLHQHHAGAPVRISFIGSLNGLHKGPDVLLDAAATLIAEGVDLRVTIIGTGHAESALRAQAAPLGDRVRFTGQLSAGAAVRAVLDNSDLFVLPTLSEGLPRSVIEAMARGLPVIASGVGGVVELLPPADTVPPRDPAALAAKIREVVSSPGRMVAMAAANLARSRDYRASVLTARRVAFYEAVADRTAAYSSRSRGR